MKFFSLSIITKMYKYIVTIVWAVLLVIAITCATFWYYYDTVYNQVYPITCDGKRSICYIDQCFLPTIPSQFYCVTLFGTTLNSGQLVWNEQPSTPTSIMIITALFGVLWFMSSIHLCSVHIESLILEEQTEDVLPFTIFPPVEVVRVVSQESASETSLLSN